MMGAAGLEDMADTFCVVVVVVFVVWGWPGDFGSWAE